MADRKTSQPKRKSSQPKRLLKPSLTKTVGKKPGKKKGASEAVDLTASQTAATAAASVPAKACDAALSADSEVPKEPLENTVPKEAKEASKAAEAGAKKEAEVEPKREVMKSAGPKKEDTEMEVDVSDDPPAPPLPSNIQDLIASMNRKFDQVVEENKRLSHQLNSVLSEKKKEVSVEADERKKRAQEIMQEAEQKMRMVLHGGQVDELQTAVTKKTVAVDSDADSPDVGDNDAPLSYFYNDSTDLDKEPDYIFVDSRESFNETVGNDKPGSYIEFTAFFLGGSYRFMERYGHSKLWCSMIMSGTFLRRIGKRVIVKVAYKFSTEAEARTALSYFKKKVEYVVAGRVYHKDPKAPNWDKIHHDVHVTGAGDLFQTVQKFVQENTKSHKRPFYNNKEQIQNKKPRITPIRL